MNILITGGAGFIGSHLAETFAANRSHDVAIVDNFADYYSPEIKRHNAEQLKGSGVEVHDCDLVEDSLAGVVRDVDCLLHCAAQPGISASVSFAEYNRNNEIATQRLLQLLEAEADPDVVVNISSSSVYGTQAVGKETAEPQPTSYYGVTKLAAEQLMLAHHREHGLPVVSLRLFSVYGPRERPEKLFPTLITSILSHKEFPLYKGSREHVRSFTYVRDVVEACRKVVANRDRAVGEILNIGTTSTNTTGEAITAVEEALETKADIKEVPARTGDQEKTSAKINKANSILDWNPQTTLREGVEETVEWFKDNYQLYT